MAQAMYDQNQPLRRRMFMLKRRPRSWVASTSAAIMLLVAGCGESKVSQCNRLAEVVNQTQGFMQEFEAEIASFSSNAAQVESLDDIKGAAEQYITAVDKVVGNLDTLVTDLEGTELDDEELVTYRDNYIQVVQGFSTALQGASSAMAIVGEVESEADLPAKIEESQQQTMDAVGSIQELSVQESTIISEVNAYCGADATSVGGGEE
jgi:type I site-specific restriction endonuclease